MIVSFEMSQPFVKGEPQFENLRSIQMKILPFVWFDFTGYVSIKLDNGVKCQILTPKKDVSRP